MSDIYDREESWSGIVERPVEARAEWPQNLVVMSKGKSSTGDDVLSVVRGRLLNKQSDLGRGRRDRVRSLARDFGKYAPELNH